MASPPTRAVIRQWAEQLREPVALRWTLRQRSAMHARRKLPVIRQWAEELREPLALRWPLRQRSAMHARRKLPVMRQGERSQEEARRWLCPWASDTMFVPNRRPMVLSPVCGGGEDESTPEAIRRPSRPRQQEKNLHLQPPRLPLLLLLLLLPLLVVKLLLPPKLSAT